MSGVSPISGSSPGSTETEEGSRTSHSDFSPIPEEKDTDVSTGEVCHTQNGNTQTFKVFKESGRLVYLDCPTASFIMNALLINTSSDRAVGSYPVLNECTPGTGSELVPSLGASLGPNPTSALIRRGTQAPA
ncbi:hypothetical protein JOB18_043951 [Solea senegalensis]|uniref:Uncharacterized protein n=1 Tax=Solea senegalensis TaxID=28829 RepID=A0AAV6R2P5_SOLSE|nr:hypothetical protein JOB18_043951 [Solea senegalensis]